MTNSAWNDELKTPKEVKRKLIQDPISNFRNYTLTLTYLIIHSVKQFKIQTVGSRKDFDVSLSLIGFKRNDTENRNSSSTDGVFQKLANLLYESARKCGCVDPTKVEEILGVSQEEAAVPENSAQG